MAPLWRLETEGVTAVTLLPSGAPSVRAVALAPGLAITSGQDGARTTLRVHPIDPATCEPTGEATTVFAPPTPYGNVNHTGSNPDGQETPIAFAVSPDGRWLLSGGRDGGSATLWKVDAGTITPHATLPGHQYGVFAMGWAPDGTRAVTCGSNGATILWKFDPATGQAEKLEDLLPAAGKSGFAESVAWAPDGKSFCIGGGHYHTGRVWCYPVK
jgi:WD40 repeat protein